MKTTKMISEVIIHTTERLQITQHKLPKTNSCGRRSLFVCRYLNEDQPEVIAHATVWQDVPSLGGTWLDWLEVNSRNRRQGVGREFRRGIVEMVGSLISSDASPDGTAFRKAIGIGDGA